ncbi:glycoside hydrolase family 11 protein [Mucilaginibacter sp. FT3.2]|uniref:glycoside hydrolase family 11 protein n=1 Tax=Mucilaginibacter sp. FT3.2 TaxID=2723090 RepID=UPI001839732B|nr:glycoside hydrolase family 11 protein [Mucilaginibacter sp. FT3.2]MBB6233298.1 endo-1,4-beta-xylanase [Mucilaginibacter sp. FT3.2]
MKKINFLPGVARKVTFGAAIIAFAASSSMLTSCKKESATVQKASSSEPVPVGERSSGFVKDNLQPNSTGTNNGFFWSLYQAGGTASLTNGSAGNFSISYSNVSDVVGGKGWNPGSARNIGYNVGSLSGSYNFVGVYGWTTSPLIEYYVCELGSVAAGSQVNTVSSDGHTYTFYKHQQVSQPSITGTATFWQYLDNWGGSSTGSNHSINMANHVNNWASNGGQGFGSYNYQILALEAYSGKSGYVNATVW